MRFRLLAVLLLSSCSTAPLYQRDYACEVKEPVEYCSNFNATGALRSDPDAQRVKVHCIDFYREAVRSTKLLCSYFGELDKLTTTDDGRPSATVSALGKRLHRQYAERAERFSEDLERVYTISGGRGSQGAVEELTYDGKENLDGELGCKESEGKAPGLELLGLAAQTRRDQKETYERLQAALSILSGVTSLKPERPYSALRTAMKFDTHKASYQQASERIVSGQLDEPGLLALGKAEVPASPELERYYAYSMKRAAAPKDAPFVIREESTGRSLASVRCQR
jgi:hypothetical protein